MRNFSAKKLAMVCAGAAFCACITTQSEAVDYKPSVDAIQAGDQKHIADLVKNSTSYTEARCLFTYSGWAYPGQHCVLVEKSGITLVLRTQGAKEFKQLSPTELIKKPTLADFDKIDQRYKDLKSTYLAAMDNNKYQYLIFAKKDSNVYAVKNLIIDNPHASKEHLNFVADFMVFFKTEVPKK